MISSDIIKKFELQCSDITELSTAEELDLLNQVYQSVCADRPFEFLKTSTSGSITLDIITGMYYIDLPADFAFFPVNNDESGIVGVDNNPVPAVVLLGSNLTPYGVVNYSDRRAYRTRSGYAYLDMANNRIQFGASPTLFTYEFDYIKVPATLALPDSPIIPARFQDVLFYGMAMDNEILQRSDKAKSYLAENKMKFDKALLDLEYWNSQLTN